MSYILPHIPTLEKYQEFLSKKVDIATWSGFEVAPEEIHKALYPHQRDTVLWALKMGRGLIAKRFGLGKSITQCEIARQVVAKYGGKFLQVCPLGAKYMFQEEDGPRLGMTYQYVTSDAEIEAATTPFLITNYERIRDGNIDPRKHPISGMSLDEGDIIRLLDSKTFWVFIDVCADVPWKWVATATPNPNNHRELIYFAHWLGIADYGQLLTIYFQRNPDKAGDLTLMPHQADKFWLWVASWCLFLYAPSDLGYDDTGYTLPEVRIHWHKVEVDHSRAWEQVDSRGQHRMFLNAAGGVSEAAAEKRETLSDRVQKMLEIMRDHDPAKAGKKSIGWLLWHDLEAEREAIEKAVPAARSVYGSQKQAINEALVTAFGRGEFEILAGKPEMIGSGPNFQYHCADAIFLGVGYKFKDIIQAVHRIVRYLQTEIVDIHFIYAESEEGIVNNLREKWTNYDEQTERMRAIIRENGLTHRALEANLKRSMGVAREEVKGQLFSSVLNDTVIEMLEICQMLDKRDWRGLKARLGHLVKVSPENIEELTKGFFKLILTSIPFGNHYEYSTQYEDFGHNISDAIFWEQMDYLIPALLRLTEPGRLAFIHVKDRILYGHQTPHGFMEVGPFSDQCVMAFQKHGWIYEGRRTIVTDVVRENASTYRLGWSECCKDSSKMGSGLPEYVLLFRKPATDNSNSYADTPVTKDKYERLTCTACGHELDKSLFSELDRNRYGDCPACEKKVKFEVIEYGYSRSRWQIDAHSFWKVGGNRLLTPSEAYDYEAHVARMESKEKTGNLPASSFYEPPQSVHPAVWTDVNFMFGLNSYQSQKRTEKHLCPLPFDIVDRGITLYSNPGDLILEPFGGLGTTAYRAILKGRKCYMTELHPPYHRTNVKYCQDAEIKAMAPTLWDLSEYEQDPGEGSDLEAWLERNYPALLDEYRGKAVVTVNEPVLTVNGKGAHA